MKMIKNLFCKNVALQRPFSSYRSRDPGFFALTYSTQPQDDNSERIGWRRSKNCDIILIIKKLRANFLLYGFRDFCGKSKGRSW